MSGLLTTSSLALTTVWKCPVLSSRARACRRDRQVPSAPLPDCRCYLRQRDVTRLLRGRYSSVFAPMRTCANPVGSPLLRLFTSFEESLQVATSPCCRRSGRTMARIGLRMMPPFPSSPLSSVRRVFPSTAGRPVYQTVPYPSSASSSRRMVCLRPSCTLLPVAPYPRSKSRGAVPWYTTVQAAICRFTPGVLAPVRVMLSRSIIT